MNEQPDETSKASPAGTPFASTELAAKVREAVEKPEARRDLQVRLEIEGGQHEDRYLFQFTAVGSGEAEAGLSDRLRGLTLEPKRAKLAARDVASLLKLVDVEGLIAASRMRPRIPPDSLVGRLHVGDGAQGVTVVFMADEEQAKTAGYEPPRAVSRIVDQIYELGAKAMGTRDVRPK